MVGELAAAILALVRETSFSVCDAGCRKVPCGTPHQRPGPQAEVVVRVEYATHECPTRDAPQVIDLRPPSDEGSKPK